MKKIDGHGHILPQVNEIPKSIKDAGYFNIVNHPGKLLMTQDFVKWSRPISDETFFVEPRLEWMERHNISQTVLITLSQLYCNGVKSNQAALDIMKFQNDFHLGLQIKYPKKFFCGFVGMPRMLEATLREIEIRQKEGLKFLCLPTHYKLENGKYVSSTDKNCQEIFSLANELGLPIQFHPYDYEEIFNLEDIDSDWAGHKSPMPALTAHFYDRLISQGLHEKYPNVRFYLSHGNSVGVSTIGRQNQAWLGRPDLRGAGSKSPLEALKAENIFVDSIVHDPDLIWLLKRKIGVGQIIHGIDSPYPLGDGIDYLDDGMYPGATLDRAEKEGFITDIEKQKILSENVFNWLYGKK